jgi:hypothetical protein
MHHAIVIMLGAQGATVDWGLWNLCMSTMPLRCYDPDLDLRGWRREEKNKAEGPNRRLSPHSLTAHRL